MTPSPTADHYTVLALKSNDDLSPAALKKAYHRALLLHHPDKTSGLSSPSPTLVSDHAAPSPPKTTPVYTVDQISLAFATLRSPSAKAAYDASRARTTHVSRDQLTGLDVIDLDDMAFDESAGVWRRACRCGHGEGFVVREEELERAAEAGGSELVVGCAGCSLWVRVGFQVVEEDEEGS